ncbi:MAG: nuclear transport factor 2 family protein [Synechococcaceae cyanobacterium]|nr:nuclear transport factor 2 family protein [Synechococcaceae cyanobacterium]
MNDLLTLTQRYVVAFNNKDLASIAPLLADDFQLTDPSVKNLGPKEEALTYIHGIFTAHASLSFSAAKIIVDPPYSALHFVLVLNETILDGVDVITWENGQMKYMEAYLTPRHQAQE